MLLHEEVAGYELTVCDNAVIAVIVLAPALSSQRQRQTVFDFDGGYTI